MSKVTQYERVYRAFMERPMTMLDCFFATGILRSNVCRYVALMKKRGEVQELYKARDKYTKHTAGYYSTDKRLFRVDKPRQLSLFEEGA